MKRGFALVAVLFALTVLGIVAGTAMFAALRESRGSRQALGIVRARSAARAVVAEVVSTWNPARLNALAPGASDSISVGQPPGMTATATVHRLGPRLFMIRGRASTPSASARLDHVVRLSLVETERAAVRTRSVDSPLRPWFEGADRAPPGWACPSTNDTIAALLEQSTASDSVFFQFGRQSWVDIAGWAASAPPGGDSLEVRYAAADLHLSAERLTGVVVVGGDLVLSAGTQIVGVVLVRGSLRFDGLGGTVNGLAVASQVVAQNGFAPTAPVVAFSSCAALAAMLSRAFPDPYFGTHSGFMY